MGYRGARSKTPRCVSRASDVLEMIQQKSMHRKSETGGLTAFSKAGAAVRLFKGSRRKRQTFAAEFRCYAIDHRAAVQKDRETCESVATQWSWRSYRERRSLRGEYHTVMLETPVSRRGRVFKEKDRPYVQSTSGLTTFSRKDNGEQKIHCKAPGPSDAQKEHDDRGEVHHEECLKHTKKILHPERGRRRLMTCCQRPPHAMRGWGERRAVLDCQNRQNRQSGRSM